MFTKKFWTDATERALKTAAQAELLFVGAAQGFDLFTLNPKNAAGAALGGLFLSLLTSIGSAPFGEPGTASLNKES